MKKYENQLNLNQLKILVLNEVQNLVGAYGNSFYDYEESEEEYIEALNFFSNVTLIYQQIFEEIKVELEKPYRKNLKFLGDKKLFNLVKCISDNIISEVKDEHNL